MHNTMGSIDIHKDILVGMTSELKDPATLEMAHHVAKGDNLLLHIFHNNIRDRFTGADYPEGIRQAISVGASVYEALQSANRTSPIPMSFNLPLMVSPEINPTFSLDLADRMIEARRELVRSNPELALGVQAISSAHIAEQEYAATYAVGAAALMNSIHRDAYQFWQLEQAERPGSTGGAS